MPAILTQKYRTFLAQQFIEGLVSNSVSAYVFIGHTTPWVDAANVAVSDTNPPTPIDTVQNIDYDDWRDLIAVKRASGANSQFVVRRINWVTGTVYEQFDDANANLVSKNFYVLDTTDTPYKVYKCVWNNKGATSSTAPSNIGTTLVPTTTADGYVWQYMYTIGTENYRFLTQNWMPVLSDSAVQNNALSASGTLPTAVPLLILNAGSGYNAAAAVTTTLKGDGSGASVTSNGVVIVGGVVTRVNLATGGTKYSHVTSINVFQSGLSTQASVRAIIPPFPNHGYDPIKELGAAAIMITTQFEQTEGAKLSIANDYRRVGLIVNPLEANGNVALGTFYKQTTDITISANTGAFTADDAIINQTKTSGPTATVVDVVQNGNNNYVVRVTSLEPHGEATPFELNDVFKCLASGSEGTVTSVSNPELQKYSGEILFVNQRTPVARGTNQIEEIKLIFPFR